MFFLGLLPNTFFAMDSKESSESVLETICEEREIGDPFEGDDDSLIAYQHGDTIEDGTWVVVQKYVGRGFIYARAKPITDNNHLYQVEVRKQMHQICALSSMYKIPEE